MSIKRVTIYETTGTWSYCYTSMIVIIYML